MHRPYDALTPDEMATWDAAQRHAEEVREREPEPTRPTVCAYCGAPLMEMTDSAEFEAAPGIFLCAVCWDNHDPAHPHPIGWQEGDAED